MADKIWAAVYTENLHSGYRDVAYNPDYLSRVSPDMPVPMPRDDGWVEAGETRWQVIMADEPAQVIKPGRVKVTRTTLMDELLDVLDIVLRKNADYGDAWQRQGLNGVLVRLADKMYRVENLWEGLRSHREALVADESIEDTLRDAIGYSLLGLLYIHTMREHKANV